MTKIRLLLISACVLLFIPFSNAGASNFPTVLSSNANWIEPYNFELEKQENGETFWFNTIWLPEGMSAVDVKIVQNGSIGQFGLDLRLYSFDDRVELYMSVIRLAITEADTQGLRIEEKMGLLGFDLRGEGVTAVMDTMDYALGFTEAYYDITTSAEDLVRFANTSASGFEAIRSNVGDNLSIISACISGFELGENIGQLTAYSLFYLALDAQVAKKKLDWFESYTQDFNDPALARAITLLQTEFSGYEDATFWNAVAEDYENNMRDAAGNLVDIGITLGGIIASHSAQFAHNPNVAIVLITLKTIKLQIGAIIELAERFESVRKASLSATIYKHLFEYPNGFSTGDTDLLTFFQGRLQAGYFFFMTKATTDADLIEVFESTHTSILNLLEVYKEPWSEEIPPPTATATFNGAPADAIEILFSKDMNRSSFSFGAAFDFRANGNAVAFSAQFLDESGQNSTLPRIVRLIPNSPLPFGATIQMRANKYSILDVDGLRWSNSSSDTSVLIYEGSVINDPASAWISSLVANPNPLTQGAPLSLTALNVAHPNGSPITTVRFYRDKDGDGQLNTSTDYNLYSGTKVGNNWVLDYTPNYAPGLYRFFAQAQDDQGNRGNVVTTTARVEFAPATEGNDFDLRSRDWQDSNGDEDGVLEGHEPVTLDIRLENDSTSVLYDVSATISSTYGAQLAISEDTVEFSTFDPGEIQWDRGDFEMQLNADSANDIEFTIRVTYTKDDHRYYQDFTFEKDFYRQGTRAANFEIASYSIDDSVTYRVGNNGDGVFDSGEKVYLRPVLRNSGNADATDVDLYLAWAGSGVEPFSDGEPYGNINDGQTKSLAADDYYAVRSERTFAGSVAVDMEVRWDESPTPLLIPGGFNLAVNGVGWLDAEWPDGSEDTNFGILSPGSLLEETLTVQNRGAGALTVTAITTSNADTTISGVTLPAVIPAGGSLAVPVAFDSTGLNQTVMREITIETDGRHVDDAGLSSNMTLILAGTVTEVSGGGLTVLGSFLTGDASNSPHLVAAKAGNLDGDEYLDFAVFEEDVPGTDGSVPTLIVYEEDGAGGIVERWNSGSMFANMNVRWDAYPLAIEDFNGDGIQEIVLAVFSTDSGGGYGTNGVLHVFSRTGTDQWSSVYSGYTNHGRLLDVITGDWDKDGRKEIILTTSVGSSSSINSRRCRLYVIESNGAFGFSQIYSIVDIPDGGGDYLQGFSGLTIADSDMDGFNELIFAAGHPENDGGADGAGDQLFIYEATGNNAFTKRFSGLSDDGPYFDDLWDFAVIAVGDPDQDGKSELILADEGSRDIWIWEISGNNTWATDIRESNYEFRETSFLREGYSIAIGNVDSDPNLEIVFGTRNSASPNAFILESFAEDSYYIEWSTSLASDNPVSISIVDDSQFGSPVIFWGVSSEGLFVIGEDSTSAFDLVLFGSGISLSENATEGVASTLSATVSNPLIDTAPAFDVSFYLGDPASGGTLIANESVPSGLDGGAGATVSTSWTPPVEGTTTIYVLVDEQDLLVEFSEENNSGSRSFAILDSDEVGPALASLTASETNADGDSVIGSDESVLVSWSLTDSSGIANVQLWLDGVQVEGLSENRVVLPPLDAGVHELVLEATDGDISPQSSTFTRQFEVVSREELRVSINGQVVEAGSATPVNLGLRNIGSVFTATLRLDNIGEQDLSLQSVSTDVTFGSITETNLLIDPLGSLIVSLTLDTSSGGSFSGDLVILDVEGAESTVPMVYTINTPPVLGSISAQSVDEKSNLSFAIGVTDDGVSGESLEFGLVNEPSGMSIDDSGLITWTPSEAQGPEEYSVTVQVSDGMSVGVREFSVTVNEVNEAPSLLALGNQVVDELGELTFTAVGTDPDLPAQTLTYSLVGEPSSASINTSTGGFSWTPTEAQGPGTYTFTVQVSDGELTDSEEITVTVNEVNEGGYAETWLEDNLPPETPAELKALNVDADFDGVSNLMEYAMGMNPGIADSGSLMELAIEPTTKVMELDVQCRADDPALTFVCAVSQDLNSWTEVTLSFDSGANTWSASSSEVEIVSQTDLGNGIWKLTLRDASGFEPVFVRMGVTYTP